MDVRIQFKNVVMRFDDDGRLEAYKQLPVVYPSVTKLVFFSAYTPFDELHTRGDTVQLTTAEDFNGNGRLFRFGIDEIEWFETIQKETP